MAFFKKTRQLLKDVKELEALRERNNELEQILKSRIVGDRTVRQNLREIQKELQIRSEGTVPKELLKSILKETQLPIIYTQEDFVIAYQTLGATEFFDRKLNGTKYSSLFVDPEEFKDYSEKANELYEGASLEMNVSLKISGDVYSRTTALPIDIRKNRGYMIYLETIQPDPEVVKAELEKQKGNIAKFIDKLKPKPKIVPQS